MTHGGGEHELVPSDVVGTSEEGDEVVFSPPNTGGSVVGLACSGFGGAVGVGDDLCGAQGIKTCVVGMS